MAKYRGADGWLHDDSVEEPRRYENKESVKPPETPKKEEEPKAKDDTAPCCAFGTLMIVCPLVGAGIGYATMGFGGLLAGLGLGIAAPISLAVFAAGSAKKETNPPEGGRSCHGTTRIEDR